jgi:hypothetical protein
VKAALRFDWTPNVPELRDAWMKGGTLTIKKIYPDPKTGLYDYAAPRATRSTGKWCRWASCSSRKARCPATPAHADRRRRHDLASRRPLGGDGRAPVRRHLHPRSGEELRSGAFLQFNKDSQDQYPVEQIDKDTWKVVFDKIHSPGHEIGFSPDGKFLVMMNNLRENNCSIFSCSRSRPDEWRKVAHVEDPLWRGKYPESVPHGLLDGQLEALPVHPASVARLQRHHGGRHQDLDDPQGDPGHRPTCRHPPSPTTASTC